MSKNQTSAHLAADAFSFAIEASDCKKMSQLATLTTNAIAQLGLTAAASGMVSGPKAASGNPFHFSNWPEDWVSLYIKEDFLLADPIPRWARNSGQPITWTQLIKQLPPRDPGIRVVQVAGEHGYTEGMVIPMRGRDNSVGLISMGGNRKSLSKPEQLFLLSIGRSAFEAADRMENSEKSGSAAPILSMREIECLALLVRGHSDDEIAKMLGLSVRTVRFHFINAREKFPATSRTHLAALAVSQGYVSL